MLLQTGVPQGSVLAPILFTSFISPIHCIATQFRVHQQQYADDTQLYMEISPDHPIQVSLTLNRHFYHSHPTTTILFYFIFHVISPLHSVSSELLFASHSIIMIALCTLSNRILSYFRFGFHAYMPYPCMGTSRSGHSSPSSR